MTKQSEIWVDVPGFDGFYQVSNTGSVKRLKGHLTAGGRILKQHPNTQGYFIVSLSKNRTNRKFLVHRLVAMGFIPNPECKKEVNHINGIKTDNRLENLEWSTRIENMANAVERNAMASGERHRCSKISDKDAVHIIELSKTISVKEIASQFSVSASTISSLIAGRIRGRITGLINVISGTARNGGYNKRMTKVVDEATGEEFPSITKAAKKLNMGIATLRYQMVKAPHLTTFRISNTA